jgi:hypothetical protein
MWNIIQTIIISITIIFIIHYLFNYFKDNFTKMKTKDLVGFQSQKYKEIIDELQKSKSDNILSTLSDENTIDYNLIENELIAFTNTQNNIYL